jgi:hypothetical protein
MEKEFVPFELSLKLKLIGFDEPCLAVYRGGSLYGSGTSVNRYYDDGHWELEKNSNYGGKIYQWVSAPTFSQVFRWFRENYNLKGCITPVEYLDGTPDTYHWSIYDNYNSGNDQLTYEEAELACLEKLIEIAESK